jgi:phosphopantothenoylcysteine decarboxylase / phosphopantothenate---cysteine ligase
VQSITLLEDKHIILGVTGSIACYKAVDLASKLTQAGARVDVIMTEAAGKFVAPITFQAVTGRPVYTTMWHTDGGEGLPTHIAHVGLGHGADLFIVAPITAHTIARLANGLADDLLSVTALAAECPLLFSPAMDGGMYAHPAVVENMQTLVERGAILIPPERGRFASGMVGLGRFPDTPTLIGHIRLALARDDRQEAPLLAGCKVVVSAGGTREPLDPVRYLTNHSTGKQGVALVQAALDAGAEKVVLVSAAQDLPAPIGAEVVPVDTAEAMLQAVLLHSADADILVMAAAVADYRPANVADQKIKKSTTEDELNLPLERTADILVAVKEQRERGDWPKVVVGFAAESKALLVYAREKLERKGLDLIVANDITAPDSGFRADTNRVVLLDKNGAEQALELASKAEISEKIIARVAGLL